MLSPKKKKKFLTQSLFVGSNRSERRLHFTREFVSVLSLQHKINELQGVPISYGPFRGV